MYTLRLGSIYLAPRFSIKVEEATDFEQLTGADSNAAKCGECSTLDSERQFTFKLHLIGGCSLASAWAIRNTIDAQLDLACDSTIEILLRRRVQDEPELVYRVTRGHTRMVDTINQFTRERILTIELQLTLVATTLNLRTPAPVVLGISFPRPTVSVATTTAITPTVSTISFGTPVINIGIPVDALVMDIGFPTFVRDLGGVDVTAGTTSFAYNLAKQKMLTGQIDLDTDDIRSLLVMTNTTADTEDDVEFISQFTTLDEFNGAGYARVALAGEAVNADVANARAEFDANDTAFAALSNGTRSIAAIMLFKFVVDDTQSIPICYLNFSSFNPGGGVLTCEWSAEGIMWLT